VRLFSKASNDACDESIFFAEHPTFAGCAAFDGRNAARETEFDRMVQRYRPDLMRWTCAVAVSMAGSIACSEPIRIAARLASCGKAVEVARAGE